MKSDHSTLLALGTVMDRCGGRQKEEGYIGAKFLPDFDDVISRGDSKPEEEGEMEKEGEVGRSEWRQWRSPGGSSREQQQSQIPESLTAAPPVPA